MRYEFSNESTLVQLKYIPQQVAFLEALRARHCIEDHTWSMDFGNPASLNCPTCGGKGYRDYGRMLLLAGRQGGKTRIGTLAAVLEASMPGARGWVSAPTYRDLVDVVEPAFFAQAPAHWREYWSLSDRTLNLPHGAHVAFRSLHDPNIARGPELDFWLVDEACQVSDEALEIGDPMLSIRQGIIIATTTPQGEDWVYEQLYTPAAAGVPGHWFATWKSADNPSQSGEYLAGKRATMSPEMYAQEYEASIVNFRGAIYGGLVDPCVVEDDVPDQLVRLKQFLPDWPYINPQLTTLVGLDPGSDHPFAGAFGVITSAGIVIAAEYEERKSAIMLHARRLKELALTTNLRWVCDRSQAQTMIELAQHGIMAAATESGPGSVDAGIERLKTWMLSGQLIIVKSRCPRLIARLKSYRYADSKKNDGSTGKQEPYKKNDDLPDALRYLVMSWPHLPQIVATVATRDLSNFDDKTRRDMERVAKHTSDLDKARIEEGISEFTHQSEVEEYASYDSMYANW